MQNAECRMLGQRPLRIFVFRILHFAFGILHAARSTATSHFCIPHFAFCIQHFACCSVNGHFAFLYSAFCILHFAFCMLHFHRTAIVPGIRVVSEASGYGDSSVIDSNSPSRWRQPCATWTRRPPYKREIANRSYVPAFPNASSGSSASIVHSRSATVSIASLVVQTS